MAKGAQAKSEFYAKIQEIFPNAFMQDAKIMRIPWIENGEQLELKLNLTCAKDILGSGNAAPVVSNNTVSNAGFDWSDDKKEEEIKTPIQEPTQEEKENLAKLLKSLDL